MSGNIVTLLYGYLKMKKVLTCSLALIFLGALLLEASPLDINSLTTDKKYVWIGLENHTLKRFDKNTKETVILPFKGWPIYSDGQNLFILEYKPIPETIDSYKLSRAIISEDKVPKQTELLVNEPISYNSDYNFEEKNNVFWVAGKKKLYRWDKISLLKEFSYNNFDLGDLPSLTVFDYFVVLHSDPFSKGKINNKFCYLILDKTSEKFTPLTYEQYESLHLNDNFTIGRCLQKRVEENGFVWGCQDEKLCLCDLKGNQIEYYNIFTNDEKIKRMAVVYVPFLAVGSLMLFSKKEENIMALSSSLIVWPGLTLGLIPGYCLAGLGHFIGGDSGGGIFFCSGAIAVSASLSTVAANIAKKKLKTDISVTPLVIGTYLGCLSGFLIGSSNFFPNSIAPYDIPPVGDNILKLGTIFATSYIGARVGMKLPLVKVKF